MRRRLEAVGHEAQRGVTSIAVVTLIMIGLSLALLHAHRGLVTDITAAANEERAVRAFEAAEAGLAWATTQMNSPEPVNTRCEPAAGDPRSPRSTLSFLERIGLGHDPALAPGSVDPLPPAHSTGSHWAMGRPRAVSPLPAGSIGTTRSATASCVRRAGSWQCACPHAYALSTTDHDGTTRESDVAFTIDVSVDPTHTAFQVASQGCGTGGPTCVDVQLDGATARVSQAFRRLVLFRPEELLNPGTSSEKSFEGVFSMTTTAFSQLPSVATAHCEGDCAPVLVRLAERGYRLIRIDGHAAIRSQLVLGSPDKPVLLVVSGTLALGAPLQFTGLLYATELVAHHDSQGSLLRGALMSAAPAPAFALQALSVDASVLTELAWRAGPILPLPGTWDDR